MDEEAWEQWREWTGSSGDDNISVLAECVSKLSVADMVEANGPKNTCVRSKAHGAVG